MRGLYSSKTKIRHQIFTEIARMAYEEDGIENLEKLPYKIIPGEIATYRDSIFLERAVVGERLRVAMGMSLRSISEHAPISQGVEASVIEEKYYEPPLINVIKFACNSCAEKKVMVTEGCQGCLEHPCVEVCPKKAISMVKGHSYIDQEKCIKCGKCVSACPYNAIIKQERPCAAACGMGAIHSDQYGRAEIDQDKCVSCGMCLVSCPFSAIVDKGQIYQTIMAIKSGNPVYAIVAPAVAGQFEGLKDTKIREAFKALGYDLPDIDVKDTRKNLRKFGKDENVVEVWEEDGQDVWLEHWIEDFLDEDSGEVVPVQRHEWHRVAIEESPWRKEDEQTEAQEGEADEIPAEPEE